MKAKLFVVIPAMGAMTLFGCTQSPSPTVSKSNEIPFFTSGWAVDNLAATFETHKETMEQYDNTDRLLGEDAVVDLWNTSDATVNVPVAGGTVTMNGTSLTLVDETSHGGGKYYQLDVNAGNSVPFSTSGGSLVFSASGSTSFAGLTDSILFPNSDIHVTAPIFGTSISKSTGFMVAWDHVTGSTNSIAIQLLGDSAGYKEYIVSDNGSYSIPSTDLSSFSGDTRVRVSRISYRVAQDALSRNYAIVAYTTSTIYHSVVP